MKMNIHVHTWLKLHPEARSADRGISGEGYGHDIRRGHNGWAVRGAATVTASWSSTSAGCCNNHCNNDEVDDKHDTYGINNKTGNGRSYDKQQAKTVDSPS